MRLPPTVEQALVETERNAAWMRKRFPEMLLWANESYSSSLSFFSCVSIMSSVFSILTDIIQGGHKQLTSYWRIWNYKACVPVETG